MARFAIRSAGGIESRAGAARLRFGFVGVALLALNLASGATAFAQTPNATARSAGPPTPVTSSTQGDLGRPYVLPQASRARMHACGIEWQKRKMSGAAGDEIWRVFASECLVAPGDKILPPARTPRR